MSPSLRSLPLVILLLGFGLTTSNAQSVSSANVDGALTDGSAALASSAASSVVVFDNNDAMASQAVVSEQLSRFVEAEAIGTSVKVESASFHVSGVPARPQEMSGVSTTRKVMYVVGGALVVGGAVAGILALSGDDGGTSIPAPPSRP